MSEELELETGTTDPEPEPAPEPARIKVRVIEEQGKSTLVQRADFRRYYVPTSKVVDGTVAQDDLDKCPLYGIPWEQYLGLDDMTADVLAWQLRHAGIYTLADLRVRDRQLIRIGTNTIGRAVREAADRAAQTKPPKEH